MLPISRSSPYIVNSTINAFKRTPNLQMLRLFSVLTDTSSTYHFDRKISQFPKQQYRFFSCNIPIANSRLIDEVNLQMKDYTFTGLASLITFFDEIEADPKHIEKFKSTLTKLAKGSKDSERIHSSLQRRILISLQTEKPWKYASRFARNLIDSLEWNGGDANLIFELKCTLFSIALESKNPEEACKWLEMMKINRFREDIIPELNNKKIVIGTSELIEGKLLKELEWVFLRRKLVKDLANQLANKTYDPKSLIIFFRETIKKTEKGLDVDIAKDAVPHMLRAFSENNKMKGHLISLWNASRREEIEGMMK